MNISVQSIASFPTPLGNFSWKEFNGEEGTVTQQHDTFFAGYRLGSHDGYATLGAALAAAHRITAGEQDAAVVMERANGTFGLKSLLVRDAKAGAGVGSVTLESNSDDDGSHAYGMRPAGPVAEALRAIVDGDFERKFNTRR